MPEPTKQKVQFGFFQNPKVRVFLALGVIAALIAGIVLFVQWRANIVESRGSAGVSLVPDISSIPGAGHPSAAYVKAQTEANIKGEIAARKSATAFVPTITRPGFIGNPSQFGKLPTATDHVAPTNCPISKVVVMYKPNPENCTPKNLDLARQSGVTAEELLCQGCACPALKAAGYTAGDLKQIGMTATQLQSCGFSLRDLVSAGFSAANLRAAGFSAIDLNTAGFTAGELRDAGFSAQDLKAAGYSAMQLKTAGYSAAALKAAGFSAATLKAAGFSASALKAAGFSAANLKAAGFSASALKAAGFSNADLRAAGFTSAEITAADETADTCNVAQITRERMHGVSATTLRQQDCNLAALKAAGFSAAALRAAGFSAADLKNAGFTATQLKNAGFSAMQLRAAGYSATDLKNAGFTATQLKNAGFNAVQLRAAGYSATDLKNAGFSAAALKAAGFSAGQLLSAGFSPTELHDAGFTASELRKAGATAAALRAAGYGLNALKAAGYTKGDLLRAGFSPAEAGYEQTVVAQTVPTQPAQTAPTGAPLPSITGATPEGRLAAFEKQEQQDMNTQQRVNQIQRMQGLMTAQAQNFMMDWGHVNPQLYTKAPAPASSTGTAGGLGASADKSASQEAEAGGPTLKAGTVLFAVIDTSINSDEQTPIMARIVAGPMTGGRLMGTFARQHKALLIQFTLLNDPHYPKSIPLNAVAIDPDTARTAISGHVNSHYLLRYGTLFASSFLQGISEGIINQGVTTECAVGHFFCSVKQSPLNTRQQLLVGLGKVGQQYAQHMGQNFNRPPTIRVAAGTGLGVLLMADLTLPANPMPLPSHQRAFVGLSAVPSYANEDNY